MGGVLDHPWSGPLLLGAGFLGGLVALAARNRSLPRGLRRVVSALRLPVGAALGALAFLAVLWLIRPYVPAWMTQGHGTPRTCAEARAMGYANARRGTPGYFAHLDADGDGISCEPRPRWASPR